MKTLQELSLLQVSFNVDKIGRIVALLPPNLKSLLLEQILRHNQLSSNTWASVVNGDFFADISHLRIPQNLAIRDSFMHSIAASGCKLSSLSLVVPFTQVGANERLSGRGVAALLGYQDELEKFNLVWTIGFRSDVLTRLNSSNLTRVSITGDGICRCFSTEQQFYSHRVEHYQRDFAVLAINNPHISHLSLESVILDLTDCYSLLSALGDRLEVLKIRVVRFYAYCRKSHCFYGEDLLRFLQFADKTCKRLRKLCCYSLQPDCQSRQLTLHSCTLTKLDLEGHYFQAPLILPAFLTELKISINGYETESHFVALAGLPCLQDFYVTLDDQYHIADEEAFLALFSLLGAKIKGIRNLNQFSLPRFADFIVDFVPNLQELGVPHQQGGSLRHSTNGACLAPVFQSSQKAALFTRLQLGIESLCQTVLIHMGDLSCRLTCLDLAYCQSLDDTILSTVARNCCSTLRVLDVSACPLLTDLSIISVAEYCADVLQEISLFQTKVSDRAVVILIGNCSRLRVCGISPGVLSEPLALRLQRSSLNIIIGLTN